MISSHRVGLLSRISLILKRTVVVVLAALALTYAFDYLRVRYKMAHSASGSAFGTVQMERLYAIPQKNGKIEYELDARQPEVTVPCVHALFPHMDERPCWYLQRNSQKPIPM
jgi:hypothetical protein